MDEGIMDVANDIFEDVVKGIGHQGFWNHIS